MSFFGGRTDRPEATGFSVVDDKMTIRGDIDTDGTVRVDGRVEGRGHRAGVLIVGVGGIVIGDVEARDVVVAGVVQGSVYARGRVEVEANAAVHGDVRASVMALHEGGNVHGHVSVGPEPRPVAANPMNRSRIELSTIVAASNSSRSRG